MAKINCTWCMLWVAFAAHCLAAEPAGVREDVHLGLGLRGSSVAYAADVDSLVDEVLVQEADTGNKKDFVNQVLVEMNAAEHQHSSEEFGELKKLGARLDGLIPAEDNRKRVNHKDFPALEKLSSRLSGMMKEPAMEPATVMVEEPTLDQPSATLNNPNAPVGPSGLASEADKAADETSKAEGGKKEEGEKKEGGEKKEEGEEGEELEDLVTIFSDIPTVNLWAFGLIVTFLVFFTLVFEHGKEHVEHMVAGSANQPIVQSIFGELTVLGFLALLCFLLNKWGLNHVSTMIFGSAEAEDKEKLGEMLESIHMVIFLVMIVFVMEAIGMLWIAGRGSAEWGRKEEQMLTPKDRHAVYDAFEKEEKGCCSSRPAQKLLQFLLMRQEFINDELEDEETKKQSLLSNGAPRGLRDDFSFTVYLEKVMGARLGEVVRLDVFQWITLELAVLFFIIATITISKGSWLFLLVIWLSWSWLLVLLAHLFLRGLQNVQQQLMHDQDGKTMRDTYNTNLKTAASASWHSVQNETSKLDDPHGPSTGEGPSTGDPVDSTGEGSVGSGNGLNSTADESTYLVAGEDPNVTGVPSPRSPNSRSWIAEVPRYQLDETLDNRYSWVPFRDHKAISLLRKDGWKIAADGTCTEKSGSKAAVCRAKLRFYNLFMYGKDEISFQLYVIRFFFLGTAVYCSVYFLHIVPTYVVQAYSTPVATGLVVAGLLPSVLLYTYYITRIIDASVLITSVEYFRHRRQVEAVKIHQKENRTVLMLRLMVALHQTTPEEHEHEEEDSHGHHSHEVVAVAITSEEFKEDLARAKEFFEKHKSNKWLTTGALGIKHDGKELLKLGAIFDELDTNHNGVLSHKEIIKVLQRFGLNVLDKHELKTADKAAPKVDEFLLKDDIEKAAFVVFMKYKFQEAKRLDGHSIAHMCFKTFNWDEDDSKQLSVEELQMGLSDLGEAFTPNEVTSLMVKLDVNDDGEFSEHEFGTWIDHHSVTDPSEQEGVFGMGILGF